MSITLKCSSKKYLLPLKTLSKILHSLFWKKNQDPSKIFKKKILRKSRFFSFFSTFIIRNPNLLNNFFIRIHILRKIFLNILRSSSTFLYFFNKLLYIHRISKSITSLQFVGQFWQYFDKIGLSIALKKKSLHLFNICFIWGFFLSPLHRMLTFYVVRYVTVCKGKTKKKTNIKNLGVEAEPPNGH